MQWDVEIYWILSIPLSLSFSPLVSSSSSSSSTCYLQLPPSLTSIPPTHPSKLPNYQTTYLTNSTLPPLPENTSPNPQPITSPSPRSLSRHRDHCHSLRFLLRLMIHPNHQRSSGTIPPSPLTLSRAGSRRISISCNRKPGWGGGSMRSV